MAKDFAQRYPLVKVDANALLVEDGAVATTGAVSSTFDLGLHLIRRHPGAEVATATARIALLPGQREKQAPYADARLLSEDSPSFSTHVTQWFNQQLSEPYSLDRLASAFCVSDRTLFRRIKADTGGSPLAILQQARVNRAKTLLSSTSWSIPRIMETVGYGDLSTFSMLFKRWVGESPAGYRQSYFHEVKSS